ncbi:MAG: hypothetical protein JWQ43_620 [Glaciihabitans sp.]|nr:hypothetical protein [Glaciihabitans sp.]
MHSALPAFASPPPDPTLTGIGDLLVAVTPCLPGTAASAIVSGLSLCGIHLAFAQRVRLTWPSCGAVPRDPTGDRP